MLSYLVYLCLSLCTQDVILWVQNPTCDSRAAGDIRFAHILYTTVMERTNKTKFIKVRVTEEEKRFILERANSAGVTLSVFARSLLLSETLRSKTDVQMVFQMKKIGTNLNQIAHYINMLPFDENVISSLSDINKLVDDINVIAKKLL